MQPELTEIVFEDWFRVGDGFSVRPFGIGNVRIGQNRQYAGPGLLFADYDVEGPLDEDLTRRPARAAWAEIDLRTGDCGRRTRNHRPLPAARVSPAGDAPRRSIAMPASMQRLIEEGESV